MASVNKVILIGKLGKDPEIKHTPSGNAVCTFSVATSERWTDNGKTQEKTEWHRIVVWNKLAENCAKYLAKGRSVYVEGKLETRKWDDKNGQKQSMTEVKAKVVNFLVSGVGQGTQAESAEQVPSIENNDGYERYPSQDNDDLPF
ncbi:MAG: single-stranded DNA-binding protein [Proteobacteria bacterium]|nr:MAG: single-stranded DNA-binding protein [Pseudomonadota bacterium]